VHCLIFILFGGEMRKLISALLGATVLSIAGAVAARAADMPAYTKAPAALDPVFTWSGFYIGGHAGGDVLRNANATVDPADAATVAHFGPQLANGFVPRSYSAHGSGFVGGGQLGYNWQMRNVVLGLETDVSIPSVRAHQDIATAVPGLSGSTGTFDADVLWFGTTRARLGVLVDPRLLAYATGGVAYGSVRRQFSFGFPSGAPIEQTSSDHTGMSWGWAAGAGIEWAVADRLTVRGEYQFVRLQGNSSMTNNTGGACSTIVACNFNVNGQSIDNHTVTLGVSYLFGR
jgi:outer membrane immunogenic protein